LFKKSAFRTEKAPTQCGEGGTERRDLLREYRTSRIRSRFDAELHLDVMR